jgi:hypothetical protein
MPEVTEGACTTINTIAEREFGVNGSLAGKLVGQGEGRGSEADDAICILSVDSSRFSGLAAEDHREAVASEPKAILDYVPGDAGRLLVRNRVPAGSLEPVNIFVN